jgi:hypothetical protein
MTISQAYTETEVEDRGPNFLPRYPNAANRIREARAKGHLDLLDKLVARYKLRLIKHRTGLFSTQPKRGYSGGPCVGPVTAKEVLFSIWFGPVTGLLFERLDSRDPGPDGTFVRSRDHVNFRKWLKAQGAKP